MSEVRDYALWPNSTPVQIGDRIGMTVRRSGWAIWRDRIRFLTWNVAVTEYRLFECTDMSAGAIWPEVK